MILQRDSRLNENIQVYGCYFMVLIWNKVVFQTFGATPGWINGAYRNLVAPGVMNKQCFIEDPEAVCAGIGFPVEFTWRHESPEYECKLGEFEALVWEHPDIEGLHFTGGNGVGNPTYDPWGSWDGESPWSRTVSEGDLVSKRIFRIK